MLTITPPQPISVYEYQPFLSRHLIQDTFFSSVTVTLLDYTIHCPASSNVVVSITSNVLSISGVYKGIFEDDFLEYRTSGLTTTMVRVHSYDELPTEFYKAVGYHPDRRPSTSIGITINTNLGTINLVQTVYNDWNAKRNRVIRFIKRGTLNVNDVFYEEELPSPAFVFGDFLNSTETFSYNRLITADTNNLVLDQATMTAAGWDGVTPIRININVNSGVVVGSNSTGAFSLDTGTTAWPVGSILSITNYGYIIGAGGNGASGTGYGDLKPGSPGGPAIRTNLLTQIYNYGIIGGGGGGSGREGYGGNNGGAGAGGNGQIPGYSVGVGATAAKHGSLLKGGITGYGAQNGGSTAPEPTQFSTYGTTIGQDGNVGGYGGLGGVGGNAITGFSYVTFAVQGRVHGRTSG